MLLIPEATDRIPVFIRDIIASHVSLIAVEVPAVCVAAIALASGPEVRVVAESVVAAAVEAGGNGRKPRGVRFVARIARTTTFNGIVQPSYGGGQRIGNVRIVASAHILALAAHVVCQLRPFRIIRYMPALRADASTKTQKTHTYCIVGIIVRTRLTVHRIERVHSRIPVVQHTVGRGVGGTAIHIVCLLTRVGVTGRRGIQYCCSRAWRGRAPHILFRPALSANLHRMVLVSLVVRNRGGSAGKTSAHTRNV